MRDVAALPALVAAASAAAYALAAPGGAPVAATARAVADCLAVGVLGLAIVPALDTGRRRLELVERATVPLAVAGGAWLLAELVLQVILAAQATGVPVWRLSLGTLAQFTLHTGAGRAGIVGVAAAAVVCATAATARRAPPVRIAMAGAAAVGVTARAISGHLSHSTLGAVAVAVHALAAAVWCGALAALALTVTHRGQWARILPRFSQLSLVCVALLLAGGVVGALVVVDEPSELVTSGYGRLLLAKAILAIALVTLGWRNRTVWVPAARAHRATAEFSRRRSAVEVALMVVALTLAAALAVTG